MSRRYALNFVDFFPSSGDLSHKSRVFGLRENDTCVSSQRSLFLFLSLISLFRFFAINVFVDVH